MSPRDTLEQPPPLAEWALTVVLPASYRDALAGDLAEEYAAKMRHCEAPTAVTWWYRKEVAMAVWYATRQKLMVGRWVQMAGPFFREVIMSQLWQGVSRGFIPACGAAVGSFMIWVWMTQHNGPSWLGLLILAVNVFGFTLGYGVVIAMVRRWLRPDVVLNGWRNSIAGVIAPVFWMPLDRPLLRVADWMGLPVWPANFQSNPQDLVIVCAGAGAVAALVVWVPAMRWPWRRRIALDPNVQPTPGKPGSAHQANLPFEPGRPLVT